MSAETKMGRIKVFFNEEFNSYTLQQLLAQVSKVNVQQDLTHQFPTVQPTKFSECWQPSEYALPPMQSVTQPISTKQ